MWFISDSIVTFDKIEHDRGMYQSDRSKVSPREICLFIPLIHGGVCRSKELILWSMHPRGGEVLLTMISCINFKKTEMLNHADTRSLNSQCKS